MEGYALPHRGDVTGPMVGGWTHANGSHGMIFSFTTACTPEGYGPALVQMEAQTLEDEPLDGEGIFGFIEAVRPGPDEDEHFEPEFNEVMR